MGVHTVTPILPFYIAFYQSPTYHFSVLLWFRKYEVSKHMFFIIIKLQYLSVLCSVEIFDVPTNNCWWFYYPFRGKKLLKLLVQ